jgi:hypothetical protein
MTKEDCNNYADEGDLNIKATVDGIRKQKFVDDA